MIQLADNRRKVIVFSIIGLFFIGTIALLLLKPTTDETNIGQTSGTPELHTGQTTVTYNGFVELSQQGLTATQMEGFKYSLFQYAPKATTFKIEPSTIVQSGYDPENPTPFVQMTFKIHIDKQTYNARLDKYPDLTSVQTYLTAPNTNQQVFQSPLIDVTTLHGATDTNAGD